MDAIGIIGVGKLAGFLVEGLRRGGCDAPILLSPRNTQRAAELASRFDCQVMGDNQNVVDGVPLVIVAVPPRGALATIRGLRPWITNEVEHNGIRADGETVLGALIDMIRGRA